MGAKNTDKNKTVDKGDHGYSVEHKGDYIHLKTWGRLHLEDLSEPAETALKLAKKEKAKMLIDDIREVHSPFVDLQVQAKGVSVLWKLKEFHKVAIVFNEGELEKLFFSSLEALRLGGNFKGFDNVDDAVAWLKED
ncbi:MAG: STAS/SEC14 domain-containing protein [Candidatus Saccharibacteria bacterium]|nr:STAS/SEC14 domain-containing protein [Candidatus Saccharibacteria bacterium]